MRRAQLLIAILFLILGLAAPLVVRSDYLFQVLFRVFLFAALGLAWNLVGGYARQLSLGHADFFGAGAYIVWPLFGPSSVRDSAGLPLDLMASPATVINDGAAKVQITTLQSGLFEATGHSWANDLTIWKASSGSRCGCFDSSAFICSCALCHEHRSVAETRQQQAENRGAEPLGHPEDTEAESHRASEVPQRTVHRLPPRSEALLEDGSR